MSSIFFNSVSFGILCHLEPHLKFKLSVPLKLHQSPILTTAQIKQYVICKCKLYLREGRHTYVQIYFAFWGELWGNTASCKCNI